ncbi:MAG: TIR domain-containing protein [Tannerella sp.]|jgi:hypothetical protein|nr:TIR domain-containing protein [Tannerella sp.]
MDETKIFISYAHKDDAYFRVFKEGIESHSKSSKNLKWKIWSDKEIPVGALWHKVIQEEIKKCDAAILLVSANFLSSDYIENQEFLNFLQKSEEDGFIFLPILLSDCDITQWEELAKRQFFVPQGSDYGIPDIKELSYSHLCRFSDNNQLINNPYRETYHKNCVSKFEKAIKAKSDKKIFENENQKYANQAIESIEDIFQQFQSKIISYLKKQDDKINALSETVNFLINEAYRGLQPTYNYLLITFDKVNRKYLFEFEKQFKIISTTGLVTKYEAQFYANKFLTNSEYAKEYYALKKNMISWEKLGVKASISISKNDGKVWSEEKEIKVDSIADLGHYIPFTIYFEPTDKSKLILEEYDTIKVKYGYSVPVKLWGSYINRHVSFFQEPLVVELKYKIDTSTNLVDKIELLSTLDGIPKEISDTRYDMESNYDIVTKTKIIKITFKCNKFEKFRINWDSKLYFGKGEHKTDSGEDKLGLTNR